MGDFERVMALAATLEEGIEYGDSDGYGVGGGMLNIFIVTGDQRRCFAEAMHIMRGLEP